VREREMGLRKVGKLKMTVFLFLVFSMQLLPALTSPAAFPVVVVLSGDEPVMYTANKIGELLQNAMVVEKDSVFGTLILMRTVGEVIYVGHGTQQGIKVGGNIVSWENFAKEIRYVPSKTIYVAACYSENLAKIVEKKGLSKLIFGFKGLVDVDEATYKTTATIAAAKGDVERAQKLLRELTEIMIGKIVEPWKYKLWLLYETKQIRGIWHVKYYPYRSGYVKYTHPDNYIHYDIPVDGWWEKGDPSYLYVVHIPPSAVALGAAALAAAIGEYVGGHFGALLGAILAAVLESQGQGIVGDENGEGWLWIKDYTISWWVFQRFDFKIGGMCWCHAEIFPWWPGYTWWPLWYGWMPYLGLSEAPGW